MTEKEQRALCDRLLYEALVNMSKEHKIEPEIILDRLMTYLAAEMCNRNGSAVTALNLRFVADRVENGAFDRLTGEGSKAH